MSSKTRRVLQDPEVTKRNRQLGAQKARLTREAKKKLEQEERLAPTGGMGAVSTIKPRKKSSKPPTQKQLDALARGRAIRKANLEAKKK